MSRVVRPTLLCFVVVISAFAQATQESADDAKKSDIYAVYSVVLSNARVVRQDKSLIAEQTADASAAPNCAPPPEYSKSWNEILSELRGPKVSAKLEAALTVNRPYEVVNADEVKEFRNSRMPRPPDGAVPPANPKFQGVVDLFTLGNVYFDRERTIAAVTVNPWSGPLGASATWMLLEKGRDGKWNLAPPWQKGQAPPCPLLWIA